MNWNSSSIELEFQFIFWKVKVKVKLVFYKDVPRGALKKKRTELAAEK